MKEHRLESIVPERPRRSSGWVLAKGLCLVLVVAFFCGLLVRASDSVRHPLRRAHYLMGTIFEITAYGEDAGRTAEAVEEAFAAIRRADEIISNYRDDSDLSRLNREGAAAFVSVPEELYNIVRESVKYSRLTNSAFDATVGPLVAAWWRAAGQNRLLSDAERRQLLARVGYSHLQIDDQRLAVRFDWPGVEIDLGGIGKGWAIDRAVAVLRRYGIERALVNAGTSTIFALGSPPGQPAWNIAVRHPRNEDQFLAVLSLKDQSLSTSASYEKHLEIQGKSFSHILDPRTGMPVEGMLSCTVLAPTAVESDALSTAGFVLGMEKAERLLRQMGLSGILAGVGPQSSKMVVRRIASPAQDAVFQLLRSREGEND